MPFDIIHFRGSEAILRKKHMVRDVQTTLAYVEDALTGAIYKRELTNLALSEMGWRQDTSLLNILAGRRYAYAGFKKGVALDCNLSSYEYLWTGLMRIQIGFDKGKLDTGILALNGFRGERSSLGTSVQLARIEVEELYPSISCPCSVAFLYLGQPEIIAEEEAADGASISTADQ